MPTDTGSDAFLARLASGEDEVHVRVLLVAAHPDDEVIGLGAQFPRLRDLTILHITDGAPRDGQDAAAHGFTTRLDYAAARRRELLAALALTGLPPSRTRGFGVADQEVCFDLPVLARRLAEVFRELRPEVVATHPYEGGHPDHDATAFAVHAAWRLLQDAGEASPALVEMTSYHAGPDGIVTGQFLPADRHGPVILPLSAEQRDLKRRMLACYETQQQVLQYFPVGEEEWLRAAPTYDFGRPPHAGTLFYENFRWGMTGARFRSLAAQALDMLDIGGAP